MASARRWSAQALSKDGKQPIEGSICATVWPTCALASEARWFDEMYLWTEGFRASTTQRAQIQISALENAFYMLESEQVEQVGVTLSFGTVERFLDPVVAVFEAHALLTHRVVVMLRGSVERLRSRYRVRAFIEHLRGQQALVGYRIPSARIATELKALNFVQPDFAKLLAPSSRRIESWQDLVLEARVAGVPPEWMIVSGLEKPEQVALARQVGIPFGQGSAVHPPYAPDVQTPIDTTVFEKEGLLFPDLLLV